MEKKPIISVVIPLYNKVHSIRTTLECVMAQSFTEYEIIIVDDGSTDGSPEVVNQFDDSRLRLFSQANAGVSAARNRGIKEARGEYVAFLDADDEWAPEYLQCQAELIEKYPDCAVFASNYVFCDAQGRRTLPIIKGIKFDGDDGILDNYFEIASASHPPLWTSAVVARRDALLDVGGFPLGVRSGEDLLTWARLVERYRIAYTKIANAIYNLGEGYDFKNPPPRTQDCGDPVGKGLIELYLKSKNADLKRYISLWFKMRASVAIRFGFCAETFREGIKCLRYDPLNYKVIFIMGLIIFPPKIRKFIISRVKK